MVFPPGVPLPPPEVYVSPWTWPKPPIAIPRSSLADGVDGAVARPKTLLEKVKQLQAQLFKQLTGKKMKGDEGDDNARVRMLVAKMAEKQRALVVLDDPWMPEQVRAHADACFVTSDMVGPLPQPDRRLEDARASATDHDAHPRSGAEGDARRVAVDGER